MGFVFAIISTHRRAGRYSHSRHRGFCAGQTNTGGMGPGVPAGVVVLYRHEGGAFCAEMITIPPAFDLETVPYIPSTNSPKVMTPNTVVTGTLPIVTAYIL